MRISTPQIQLGIYQCVSNQCNIQVLVPNHLIKTMMISLTKEAEVDQLIKSTFKVLKNLHMKLADRHEDTVNSPVIFAKSCSISFLLW